MLSDTLFEGINSMKKSIKHYKENEETYKYGEILDEVLKKLEELEEIQIKLDTGEL